jgi:hypothetical protein
LVVGFLKFQKQLAVVLALEIINLYRDMKLLFQELLFVPYSQLFFLLLRSDERWQFIIGRIGIN